MLQMQAREVDIQVEICIRDHARLARRFVAAIFTNPLGFVVDPAITLMNSPFSALAGFCVS